MREEEREKMDKLFEACEKGDLEEARKLLKDPSLNLNETRGDPGKTPFDVAVAQIHTKTAQLLLSDPRLSIPPLHRAVGLGRTREVASLLADRSIDVNEHASRERTPLYLACFFRHLQILRRLLEDPRVDVNRGKAGDFSPLCLAACLGYLEEARCLLLHPRIAVNRTNKFGQTPFFVACQEGKGELVRLLAEDVRVDVNRPAEEKETPFFIACEQGNLEVVKLLASDPRVQVNQPAAGGNTPFYAACISGHLQVVKFLASEPRVDLYKPNEDHNTPFYAACATGEAVVVRFLLADPRLERNEIDADDAKSPIHIPVRKGFLDVVELLLSSSNPPNIHQAPFWDNATPLEAAQMNEHHDIADLLTKYEMKPRETQLCLRRKHGMEGLFYCASVPCSVILPKPLVIN